MSYTSQDFTESIQRTEIAMADIVRVVAAWGYGSGMGDDAGHWRWSEDGATDWSGGFLLELHTGQFAYVSGWCDYTGWGCQDGVDVQFFEACPDLDGLKPAEDWLTHPPSAAEWDIEPADLNRVLTVPPK